jgi:hypothetical protein
MVVPSQSIPDPPMLPDRRYIVLLDGSASREVWVPEKEAKRRIEQERAECEKQQSKWLESAKADAWCSGLVCGLCVASVLWIVGFWFFNA